MMGFLENWKSDKWLKLVYVYETIWAWAFVQFNIKILWI